MPGPFEYCIWILSILLEASVVVCALRKNALHRYLLPNVYMAMALLISITRYKVLHEYGFLSSEYLYFYFYSDALLTIVLYFAVSSLYSHVFSEMRAERYVQIGAWLLLAGTALFSYGVIRGSSAKLATRFVVELSQNLYFVGLVLTYVLWAAILKLRETRTRLIQLVLSLGVYFSLFAADYALINLYPSMKSVLSSLLPVFGCFLPLAWAYAFWRLPEEARLKPAHLVAVPR